MTEAFNTDAYIRDNIRKLATTYPDLFAQVLDEGGWRYSNAQAVERVRAELRAEYENNLRDQFAMAALTGLLANAEAANADGWSWRTGTLAGDAYAFADDAIRSRSRENDQ